MSEVDYYDEVEQYLDETGGAPNVDFDVDEVFPDVRGLVMSGGKPYILIVVEDSETGGVDVTHVGIQTELVPDALRQIADLLEAEVAA